MGYRGGQVIPHEDMPTASGPIVVDELDCPQEERTAWAVCHSALGYYEYPCPTEPSTRLRQCQYLEYNDCSHYEDVYIRCGMFVF